MTETNLTLASILDLPTYSPEMDLCSARSLIDANAHSGIECPCCGQFARVYKRKFNAGMARALIWLVTLDDNFPNPEWTDVPKVAPKWLVKIAGEFAKAAHWGLSEQMVNDDPKKRCSGLWRPTEKGRNFVYSAITIPTHVYLYDNTVVKFSNEVTNVHDALGKKFDYGELMKTIDETEIHEEQNEE
jgi:hypothetical protein